MLASREMLSIILFAVCMVVVCGRTREEAAVEYFDQGVLLCRDHAQCNDSLPFYRAAVRLDPTNPLYWFELATAESKSGQYGKLHSRSKHAVAAGLDDNRKAELVSIIQNIAPEHSIATVEMSYVSGPRLSEDGLDLSQPFTVSKYLSQDALLEIQAADLGHIESQYGSMNVEFYPQNMRERPGRVYKVSWEKALSFFRFPEGAYLSTDISEPGTYIQWNVPEAIFRSLLTFPSNSVADQSGSLLSQLLERGALQDQFLRRLFTSERDVRRLGSRLTLDLHWHMYLVGENGSGMFNHTDSLPVGSWQLQLAGRKLWKICTVSEPEVDSGRSNCYQVELGPGDLLYYPPHAWHETECLDTPTISISSSVLLPQHFDAMREAVRQGCQGITSFQFAQELCEAVMPQTHSHSGSEF